MINCSSRLAKAEKIAVGSNQLATGNLVPSPVWLVVNFFPELRKWPENLHVAGLFGRKYRCGSSFWKSFKKKLRQQTSLLDQKSTSIIFEPTPTNNQFTMPLAGRVVTCYSEAWAHQQLAGLVNSLSLEYLQSTHSPIIRINPNLGYHWLCPRFWSVLVFTLWWTNIAIEHGHRNSGFSH